MNLAQLCRRYHFYTPEFQVLNVMSTAGASTLGMGYPVPLLYFLWVLRYGRIASANPWGAKGPAPRAGRGRFSPTYYAPVEIAALYWHFVDIVWIFLFPLLTAMTVGIAFIDLERFNAIMALVIAAGKASLAILFFMHLRHFGRFVAVCLGTGLLWLALLLVLTMSDYLTRSWLPISGW